MFGIKHRQNDRKYRREDKRKEDTVRRSNMSVLGIPEGENKVRMG